MVASERLYATYGLTTGRYRAGDDGPPRGAVFDFSKGNPVPEGNRLASESNQNASSGDGDGRSPLSKDLIAAAAIAILSLVAMLLAVTLQAPGRLSTAPGLLPFVTALTLFMMAVGLGVQAMRDRSDTDRFQAMVKRVWQAIDTEETRRALLLMGIISVYVLLVDRISFDLRLPVGGFDFRFSSYEGISIVALTLILKYFWRGTLLRCGLIALVWMIALASVFRYGFHILLPGSG